MSPKGERRIIVPVQRPNIKAEIRRCDAEIAIATKAARTGRDPITGGPVSARDAVTWLTDWQMERDMITGATKPKAKGMSR